MSPTPHQIQEASARLAMTASFPTFVGGLHAFTSEDLARGCWFPLNSEHPLLGLAFVVVAVPAGHESYALRQARCHIAIEDALAALEAPSGEQDMATDERQAAPEA